MKISIVGPGIMPIPPTGWGAVEIFNTERVITIASHHQTHAASALHLSPFDKALIVSYDGGGDDGHFNVYMGDKEKGIRLLENIPSDFGGGYLL